MLSPPTLLRRSERFARNRVPERFLVRGLRKVKAVVRYARSGNLTRSGGTARCGAQAGMCEGVNTMRRVNGTTTQAIFGFRDSSVLTDATACKSNPARQMKRSRVQFLVMIKSTERTAATDSQPLMARGFRLSECRSFVIWIL